MATLSLDKTVFLFHHCKLGLGEGVPIWNNFDLFIWPFDLFTNSEKGVGGQGVGFQKFKSYYWPFFYPFRPIWNTFNLFVQICLSPKPGNYFQPIFSPFQPTWFFSFWAIVFSEGGGGGLKLNSDQFSRHFRKFVDQFFLGGGVKKPGNYFQPIFSPFPPNWDKFDFFHVDQIFLFGGGVWSTNIVVSYFI